MPGSGGPAIIAALLCVGVVIVPEATMPQTTPAPVDGLPGVTDVLVDGEHCRGAHVSTRPHNRKVIYHGSSGTWFVFHGTGHWLDKLGDAGLGKEMLAWRVSKDGQAFSSPAPAVVQFRGCAARRRPHLPHPRPLRALAGEGGDLVGGGRQGLVPPKHAGPQDVLRAV